MNSYISSLSSLDNGYIFPFLSTNSFFISIAWSQSFLVGILSLSFQTCESTCKNILIPAFLLLSLTLLLSPPLSISLILLLSSLPPSFSYSFSFPLFSSTSFLLVSFLLLFIFATLVFLILVSTAFHTFLDTSSS